MHNLVLRSLAYYSILSLACGAQEVGNGQSVLVQESGHFLKSIDHDGYHFLKQLDTNHPIPPNRGHGTDPWNLSSFTNTTYHNAYHPLFEIDEYMEHLVALYPERVTMFELGHSAQGREMYAMRVSSGAIQDEDKTTPPKKGFVISGAQHAREWVASAAALYIAHSLVANSSEPFALSHLLDKFDFYIIPVPNPDGYVFTWEDDRLWYKNRMGLGPNEPCQGLDMNRNWGYHWSPSDHLVLTELEDDESSSSDKAGSLKKKKRKKGKGKPKNPPVDPCSHWFPGHRPFEAPEVNNIANFITQLPHLEAFVDLRSYGQMLSWPYSYSCRNLPADAEDLYEAALGAASAIKKKHGTVYTTGSLCSMLYPAPGNILDWMYAGAGIKYSYAAHLRDTGTYGYSLPREWIRPVGEETATLVEYIVGFILSPGK